MPRNRSPVGRTVVALAVFVALSVVAIVLDNRGLLDPVKRPAEAVVAPVTGLFNDAAGATRSRDDELAALTAERDQYRAEAIRLQDAESENTQLREQLGIEQKYGEFEVIPAAVLARDPSNSQKFITIDQGSDDGVAVGMAVVDPNNYVGQVTEVGPSQARVTLLIDTQASPLSVEIASGGDGLLYGMWQAGGRAEVRYVDIDERPRVGDAILTTSDGATQTRGVPGGLLIGTVGGDSDSDPLTDDLTVPVLPNADFDNLEVVTVILGSKPGSTATTLDPSAAGTSAQPSADPSATDRPADPSPTDGDPSPTGDLAPTTRIAARPPAGATAR